MFGNMPTILSIKTSETSTLPTGGMLLTAAKFYSSPSQGNARLLFRASLLHLPIFMIAFLLHRRPNTGEDRLELFAHNARLLGLGSEAAVTASQHALLKAKEEEEEKRRNEGRGSGRYRVQLPPMPFLLPAPQLSVACPSKALCTNEEEGLHRENGEKITSLDDSSSGKSKK